MKSKAFLLAGLIAVTGVAANWGRGMASPGYMLTKLFVPVILVGLAVLVWLWVVKLWRELYSKKR